MSYLNKVILIGNLGKDPDIRFMPDGKVVANFSLATTDKWKDKNTGQQKEDTEWHQVVFFGRQAEIARDYLNKGSKVYIEGKNKTEKYTDSNGVERWATKVIGKDLKMLDSRQSGSDSQPPEQQPTNPQSNPQSSQQGGGYDDFEDDGIPF